jgi:hypothetical protein
MGDVHILVQSPREIVYIKRTAEEEIYCLHLQVRCRFDLEDGGGPLEMLSRTTSDPWTMSF